MALKMTEEFLSMYKRLKYRVPEELYYTHNDPYCQNNLIDEPGHQNIKDKMFQMMLDMARRYDDQEFIALYDRPSVL